jgi:hypothetical protein
VNCTFRGKAGSFGPVDSEECAIRLTLKVLVYRNLKIVQFVVSLNISVYSVLGIVSPVGKVNVLGYRILVLYNVR